MIATFFRYNLVQIVAYGLDFGSFWLLANPASVNPLIANCVGKLLAGVFAFVLHKGFTFRAARSGRASAEAVRYFTLLLLNIPLSSLVLTFLLAVLPTSIAKVASDVTCLAITFLLVRTAVFRKTSPSADAPP
jgi:putative flippase GtrA